MQMCRLTSNIFAVIWILIASNLQQASGSLTSIVWLQLYIIYKYERKCKPLECYLVKITLPWDYLMQTEFNVDTQKK